MKAIHSLLLALGLLAPLHVVADSLGGYPDNCGTASDEAYGSGFEAGVSSCYSDPGSCGISLSSCLPAPSFGETEPNDNLVSADPLQLNANFWGQSYGPQDQDWYYTQTTSPNQNIIVNFSTPGSADPSGWKVTIRDAAGNIFAEFDTGVTGSGGTAGDTIVYRATLGLVGSYYVVVQPYDSAKVYSAYQLAVSLQDSGLDTPNYVVGFHDVETEPNDAPSISDPLATSVTMYGVVNLTFNTALPPSGDDEDASYTWGQGESDWFVYYSQGNELISVTFCEREGCGVGDWQMEVYDMATASQIEAGVPRTSVVPLLSFNTKNTNSDGDTVDPETFQLGFDQPGYYFILVSHKRLFTAPCLAYNLVSGGTAGGFGASCGPCDPSNGNSCYVPVDSASCSAGLSCRNEPVDECIPGIETGCNVFGTAPDIAYYKTTALCGCSVFGGVVEVPEGAYTSPYNFTWFATQLPPSTIDTDAYQDFINRANPYN
ncbi:hypothetical protein L0E83_10655 [Marichromatium gracile]|uniref:hypothetical protein n=1 Tax=Marichromatium gracile TaxID=1048 RepID=UPI001F1FE7BB|nr:hypothetical protein [Marichromatium gracile]MCF1183890.1 hypothetical protein [Marichromatium gracile]